MNRTTQNILIASILSIITIIVALLAITFGTQTSTITLDGKTYANTTQGLQEVHDVEYMAQRVMFAMPAPIMPKFAHPDATIIIPSELPHASVAHGDYTCNLSNHGV